MQSIFNILVFLIALSLLVMVHELGHLLFAKRFQVYCYEFSIGMGPRLWSTKKGETQYSLKAFPIGGSVMMAGEEYDEATRKSLGPLFDVTVPLDRTLYGIKHWKRLLVVGGGAMFNFIFGILVLFLAVNVQGVTARLDSNAIEVSANSLIAQAGVESGDQIIRLDLEVYRADTTLKVRKEYIIEDYYDLNEAVNDSALLPVAKDKEYQEAVFYYLRDGVSGQSQVLTRSFVDGKLPLFGFTVTTRPMTLAERILDPFVTFGECSVAIFKGLGRLLTGAVGDVSGPVGIFNASSQFARQGFVDYLFFLALLSINLGIFNLIPIPGLDGATVMMTIGEMVSRKEIPTRAKGYINMIGILFLLLLIVLVSIKDIVGLVT